MAGMPFLSARMETLSVWVSLGVGAKGAGRMSAASAQAHGPRTGAYPNALPVRVEAAAGGGGG